MLSQPNLSWPGQLLLGLLVCAAAIYDIGWRRIPNWLILVAIAAGLSLHAYGKSVSGLGFSLAGLGIGFVLYFPLYLLRGLGAGDIKLLSAVGAIVGAANCIWVAILTAILGGFVALVLVIVTGRLKKTLFNIAWLLQDLVRLRAPYATRGELDVRSSAGLRLPHAVLIFLGSAAFLAIVRYRITV